MDEAPVKLEMCSITRHKKDVTYYIWMPSFAGSELLPEEAS